MSEATINAVLTHQAPEQIKRMLEYWRAQLPGSDVLVVYGGPEPDFVSVPAEMKTFVCGEGHLTQDHQRERQSYSGVLRSIASWLEGRDYEFVNLIEFDVIPLSVDWVDDLELRLQKEKADVMCADLHRVDGTFDPHFVNHLHDSGFSDFWASMGVREDPSVVLSMLGCHSFWRREVLEKVSCVPESMSVYLELYLPTLAHHLGFRVRGSSSNRQVLRDRPSFSPKHMERLRAQGVLAVHPVKEMWNSQ